MGLIRDYARWIHTRWPAGLVEKLPEVRPDGTTAVPGVRVVGDLRGVPLLKFAADSGARAVHDILAEKRPRSDPDILDLAIVGGGVSGISAAMEAKKSGLRAAVFDSSAPFSTILGFPRGKPIFTYPTGMKPAGGMRLQADTKESLLDELEQQRRAAGIEVENRRVETVARGDGMLLLEHGDGGPPTRARRVILAIGRSGDYRKLGVPGEDLDKVYRRLHDPKDFADQDVLVVGGGDSAVETAVALAQAGARVTLSYRGEALSRPKPANLEALEAEGSRLRLALATELARIEWKSVTLRHGDGRESAIANDAVFLMIGRELPLDFFRRSGIPVRGEWTYSRIAGFALFLLFCTFLYNWKSGGALNQLFRAEQWFPYNVPGLLERAGGALASASADPSTLLGTLARALSTPGFYYSLAYSLIVVAFGIRRIKRRPTPYIAAQTSALAAIQVFPLFLLPSILLPWAGANGWFDSGFGRTLADHLFPVVGAGPAREYWRAAGLILAWPLFIWNVFTAQPLWTWLAISLLQTFVAIPWLVRRWGKGAYCSWICSCGALAETLGDSHRAKMPHGPAWNRLNMTGQAILAAALLLLTFRLVSWAAPGTGAGMWAGRWFYGMLSGWHPLGIELNYYHVVDLFLAGIVGVGCYFWFSGRVWCRFACPLAALMHIYAMFSRFRIFPEKEKCISCGICTSVCHQGIDVMSFANKGLPMQDPQCVRCSACVEECPTGVLSFGSLSAEGPPRLDRLTASLVRVREKTAPGRVLPLVFLALLLPAARAAGAAIDFTGYDRLTRTYVNENGRVDYAGLKRELPLLKRFVDQIAAVSPESHPGLFPDRERQLRYYLTAYNAWVLYIAASEYPSKNSLWRFGLFRNRDIRLGGRPSSLNELEHEILRKRFRDPRIHFYINCAAASCPPFPRGAIPEGQTDRVLDEAARRFINDPAYVRFDAASSELHVSKIFDWFEEDFVRYLTSRTVPGRPDVAAYIGLHLREPQREALVRAGEERLRIRYLDYDKSLNDQGPRR